MRTKKATGLAKLTTIRETINIYNHLLHATVFMRDEETSDILRFIYDSHNGSSGIWLSIFCRATSSWNMLFDDEQIGCSKVSYFAKEDEKRKATADALLEFKKAYLEIFTK